MQLKYGSYAFDIDSVIADCKSTPVSDPPDQPPRSRIDEVTVQGWLSGASQSDITTKTLALNAALSRQFQDLVLYQDDGITPTTIRLGNTGSIGGVRLRAGPLYNVIPPATLSDTVRSNYVTNRSFVFQMTAEYALVGAGTLLAGGVPFGGPGPIGAVPSLQGQGAGWIEAPTAPFPYGGGGPIAPVSNGSLGSGIPPTAAAVLIRWQETVSLSASTGHSRRSRRTPSCHSRHSSKG